MSFDAERLFTLLPAIYRLRDGAGPGTGALRALTDVIAAQVALLEEDLEQLYDDQFIETCAEWVAPYLGDLIGYRTLHPLGGASASAGRVGSARAEVANTIAYRRRKGTASALEALARDVTGYDARAVEYFQTLAVTQYMNHRRLQNVGPVAVRHGGPLTQIGTPFETATRTAEVRRIATRRGRFNIPNVGLHLWRIRSYPLDRVPATKLASGDAADRRFLFSPLGNDTPLFNRVAAEDALTHMAGRANVPMPIGRRELWDDLAAFYPSSIRVECGGTTVPVTAVSACDLSDAGGGWAYDSAATVLIDPVLGRLVVPPALTVDGRELDTRAPRVSWCYGFAADTGGGSYDRLATLSDAVVPIVAVDEGGSIADALEGLGQSGTIDVDGDGRFAGPLTITAAAGARIELRAADGHRPVLLPDGELRIDAADDSEVTLNGFLIAGAALRIVASSGRARIRLRHCTLVPGLSLQTDGTPVAPDAPSLLIDSPFVSMEIERSILGSIRADENASISVVSSIVDATDRTRVAFAAADGVAAGGSLTVEASTIVGKVHARVLPLVSNTILAAALGPSDAWPYPVHAERRQEGCIRFSYVPPGSSTPRRHRCQPVAAADAVRVQPQFTAERYGHPAYAQLSSRTPIEIARGADDESEMGALHDEFGPQRQTNLEVRLEEYLRFGLEAGIIYAS